MLSISVIIIVSYWSCICPNTYNWWCV